MDDYPRPSFLHPRDPSIDRRYRPCPKKAQNLDEIYEDYEDSDIEVISSEYESDTETASLESLASTKPATEEGALVYLRLKPVEEFCEFYSIQPHHKRLITSTANGNQKQFVFSDIFDGMVTQKEVYEQCVKPRIDNDENFTIMSYGTSGSGKTFTLIGHEEDPGILPRALEHIFEKHNQNIHPQPVSKMHYGECKLLSDQEAQADIRVKNTLLSLDDFTKDYHYFKEYIERDHNFTGTYKDNCSIFIWVSFVEIYNENVFDLLALPPTLKTKTRKKHLERKSLKVVSNHGNVYVKELNTIHVRTASEAYHILKTGLKGVTYADTGVNANSSRSHFIFMVDIIQYSHPDLFTTQSYRFCDLAGSERQTKTNCAGSRLKEAQTINKSLVVLGRCLDTANNNITRKGNPEVIPVRESKLTMLLQPALLGKEKLCMIVALTPLEQFYEENMNVLNYASIAKNIVFKSQKKKDTGRRFSWFTSTNYEPRSNDRMVDELIAQNSQLQYDRQELTDQIIIMKAEHDRAMTNLEDKLRKDLNERYKKSEESSREAWQTLLKIETKKVEMEVSSRFRDQIEDLNCELEDLREEVLDLKSDLNGEKLITLELTKQLEIAKHELMNAQMAKSTLQRKKSNVLEEKENHF
ncbi:kinesin-A family protein [Megaselia abdita]